ncbi:MAG: hypothetical protein R3C14_31880 [Caldilineaceae bacterium]
MLIISDTNILSSLAACDALSLLFRLFPNQVIYIPPSVQQELQAGLERQRTYLSAVLEAIAQVRLQVLILSATEQNLTQQLPSRLNLGEREAIALTQNRQGFLLSNDKRAVRYCHTGIARS